MNEIRQSTPRMPKWPFLLGDLGLVGMSFWIMAFGDKPLSIPSALICGFGIAGGALLFIAPFYLEYRAALRREENRFLSDAVRKVEKLADVGEIVVNALEQWQFVQDHSGKILTSSEKLVDRMGKEAHEFMEFFEKADDSRIKTLELQVDKLQQVETDWLKTSTMILDHVFALYQAGMRSGQKPLISQLSQFMEACLDAVRRMGLVAFEPEKGGDFDDERHQVVGRSESIQPGSLVKEVVAFGYFFHGRLHRKALVYVERPQSPEAPGKPIVPKIKLKPSPVKSTSTKSEGAPQESRAEAEVHQAESGDSKPLINENDSEAKPVKLTTNSSDDSKGKESPGESEPKIDSGQEQLPL